VSASNAPPAASLATSPEPPVNRVLLATDLHPAAAHAEEEAIRLAVRYRASLIIFVVLDPRGLRLPSGAFGRRVDQERSRLESGAQRLVADARRRGAAAQFLIWEGDPAEMILSAAMAESADVVVLGSRGRTGVRRLLLGSVSAQVARDATCRVVVVPPVGPSHASR
jgi:nucleotide-binding universal stress UspA family protein